jgi:molybdenum cofactor guanylyltransferase
MKTDYPPTLGLVLAGGLARRMGGGDKALLKIGEETILDRVLARIGPQCTRVILNANGDPARFARFALPVVADDIPDFAGPLAGVLAGLDWIATNEPRIEWMASVPGDCPFVRCKKRRRTAARLRQVRRLATPGGGTLAGRAPSRPAPRARR